MKHLEIKTIAHKGVHVSVKIDYDKKQISLVEKQANGSYLQKSWCFYNREIEYMNGWIIVLEAMQVAVKEAKKELEDYLDKRTKQLMKESVEKDVAMFEMLKQEKKNGRK